MIKRLLLCLLLAACGSDTSGQSGIDAGGSLADAKPGGTPDAAGSPDAAAAVTGSYTHFVTNSLKLGKNMTEAYSYAFDLDGDGQEDDQIGTSLASFGGLLDADGRLDAAVKSGSIVLLHSLRSDNLTTDDTVSWRVLVGSPKANPDLSGNGTFTVAGNSPQDATLLGKLASGAFSGGPATVTVDVTFLEGLPALRIRLIQAKATAKVTASGCTEGKLGGAVTATDLDSMVVPALATGLDGIVAADSGCKANFSDCETSTKFLLTAFDGDGNRTITAQEVRDSDITKTIFAVDVDLLDAQGKPGHDGTKESVSLALGFTCVKATFTAAGE